MRKIIVSFMLLSIISLAPLVLAGTAFCTFEHTSRYTSDLITDEITGYVCKLDFDVKGDRVNDVGGGHEGGQLDKNVDIIKVLPEYYSYLTTFPKTFCSRFKKLEIIDMCGAEINTIDEDSLEDCKDLRILQFYRNNFEQVPENLLSENKKLLRLYITYNSNLKNLPESLLLGLSELKLLDLSYNQIDHLPAGIFDDLSSIKELNLEGNDLTNPETGLFDKLGNLEILNMNGNGISELAPGIFAGLTDLKTFYLQSNKLTIIHADAFPQAANIDTVVFTRNKINAIDEQFIDNCGISNLKMVGNVCDKTSLIRKKDMKKKLATCFNNYNNDLNENDRSTTPKPIRPTSEPRTRTTTTLGRLRPRTTETTTTTTPKPSKTTPKSKTKGQKLTPMSEQCGISRAPVQNIVEGTEVVKGTHPWIAALVHKTDGYFCGGTLYSKRFVVTAAHCVNNRQVEKKASDISVLLGVHELANPNDTGRKSYDVESIHIHDQWNPHTSQFDADIAVLKLSADVTFGSWIQPVCIASKVAPYKNINEGIIVGFGKTEKQGAHSNVPIKASTPIRKSDDCYDEFPSLIKLASYRTFCGGYANGTGACTGDSGGGLTVVQDDVHYLRGIVSASLHGTDYGCDVKSYSIFTDVKNHLSFFKKFLN